MQTENSFDVAAKPRKGRPPKASNVVTREMRELIRQTLDGFVDRIPALLSDVAETNPAAAIDRFIALSEFCIPKLNRTEHVGDSKQPIVFGVAREIIDNAATNKIEHKDPALVQALLKP